MKKILKKTKTNEALSPDEILAMNKDRIEADKKHREEEEAKRNEQKIKSIWVKELHFSPSNDGSDYADLEFTMTDGSVEQFKYTIATTGIPGKWQGTIDDFSKNRNGGNDRFVSGDMYKSGGCDMIYKSLLADLKRSPSFRKYGIEPTDTDVRISMIRIGFNDPRITWFYGKNKISDSRWAFGREMPKLENNPVVRKVAAKINSTSGSRTIFTSGNTKIYKRL